MRVNSTKELASYIQDQRLAKGLSQELVADLASVRQATVSAFESKSDNAKLDTLFKLLSALDLELDIRKKGELSNNSMTHSNLDW